MTDHRLTQIKNRVREIGIARIRKNIDLGEEFERLYKEVFHEPVCSTCPGKTEKAYSKILNVKNEIFMTTTNRRYSFKKKNTLKHFVRPIAGVPTILNNKNLLDEHVLLIIAANPKAADWFIDSHDGAKSKVKTPPPPPAPTAEDTQFEEIDSLMSASEIKAELKSLKVPFVASATKKVLIPILISARAAKSTD